MTHKSNFMYVIFVVILENIPMPKLNLEMALAQGPPYDKPYEILKIKFLVLVGTIELMFDPLKLIKIISSLMWIFAETVKMLRFLSNHTHSKHINEKQCIFIPNCMPMFYYMI